MNYLEQINAAFLNMLMCETDSYQLITDIEFYSEEHGSGLQGDYYDKEGLFIKYADYRDCTNILGFITEWKSDLKENKKWNKSQFTTFKNGHFEVKTWWDEDFQKELYPNG
ncbi:hypothetical protein [Runella zeae]|uniref:hypothetical protein n=1 Tax=Runella zeae TaxID=94255 RepID=UPI00235712BC|nr:hypothetical protein [Runella zeae]